MRKNTLGYIHPLNVSRDRNYLCGCYEKGLLMCRLVDVISNKKCEYILYWIKHICRSEVFRGLFGKIKISQEVNKGAFK